MQRYNPKDIEPKWQRKWADSKIYQATEDPGRPKKYILEYFPYPSGAAMHVGHVRNYTIGDVLARFNRMQGYNVLHPMGWDAFGLPAENYAIKTGVSPRRAVDENTAKFKQQLTQMGFSYDWSREIDSTDPKYYRWTQWFFLLLFRLGLAYQQESLQWWCPVDKTVLANEQVEAGRCWRCGNEVEKKALKQWFFKITDYADRLERDLDNVDWSDSIKTMQRNWIGRSQGAEIDFAVDGTNELIKVFTTRPDTIFGATFLVLAPEHPLVQKIIGAEQKQLSNSYVKAAQSKSDIDRQETNRQKTGVFTGAYAINPANDEKIPIWIADYVLNGYGTGAIMAVPAHDERDYEFAKQFNLPVRPVVAPIFNTFDSEATERPTVTVLGHDPETGKFCMLDWKPNATLHGKSGLEIPGGGVKEGETTEEAGLREFAEETGYIDVTVERILPYEMSVYHKIHARPRTVHSMRKVVLAQVNSLVQGDKAGAEAYEADGAVVWLTKDELLRSKLLDSDRTALRALFDNAIYTSEGVVVNSGRYNGRRTSDVREKIVADLDAKGQGREVVNYKMRDWLISRQRYWGAPIPIIHCPADGAVAVPDDQLPVVLPEIKSYEPSGGGRSPLANVPEFVNTSCPKCGGKAERETDTMDGFACSSWYFLRFADPHNDEKPFSQDKVKFWLPVDDYIGGAEHAVMHLLYARFWTKVMHDEGLIDFDEPFTTLRNQGMILAPDGSKMSKSKGNTIEPAVLIDQGYGADAVRVMELFIGPWNQSADWSVEGMGGAFRFLQRVWTLTQGYTNGLMYQKKDADEALAKALLTLTNVTTKKVSADLAQMGFNTAVAALMEFVNGLYKLEARQPNGTSMAPVAWLTALRTLLKLLAPFAPHIAEELWSQLKAADGLSPSRESDRSIHLASWPSWDEKYLVAGSVIIAVQVNGKLRGEITVPTEAGEEEVVKAAKTEGRVRDYLEDKTVHRTVYVPGKVVNFVIV